MQHGGMSRRELHHPYLYLFNQLFQAFFLGGGQ